MREPKARAEGLRSKYRGYSGARPDILRLVRGKPARILDVGSGAGVLGRDLQALVPGTTVIGVEPEDALAEIARTHMSRVINARIDAAQTIEEVAAAGPYDLIICADVLEHLADPGPVLKALSNLLVDGGNIITSLPNVRHISTFFHLGIRGSWPSRSRGIHDRTHLRFFARPDILHLGKSAGLEVISERRNLRIIESAAWTMIPAMLLDFWPLRAFFTFQYLHLWRRTGGG